MDSGAAAKAYVKRRHPDHHGVVPVGPEGCREDVGLVADVALECPEVGEVVVELVVGRVPAGGGQPDAQVGAVLHV